MNRLPITSPGRLISALLGVLVLAGCTQDVTDLQAYIEETRAKPAPHLPPFEEPAPAPTHRYPTELEREPFNQLNFAKRDTAQEADSGPRPDPNRAQESLEEFPLDSLRMAGVLERRQERWALIRDPQGTVHRVKVGNYLGQNHGRIISITENRVELVELVRVGERSWREREAAMAAREQ